MSEVPIEKKLELVHQIRSQYKQNQSDLLMRERILYGRTSSHETEPSSTGNYEKLPEPETVLRDGTFKIRFALAVVLFVTIIVLDKSGSTVNGISTEKLFQAIALDYGTVMVEWLNTVNINTL